MLAIFKRCKIYFAWPKYVYQLIDDAQWNVNKTEIAGRGGFQGLCKFIGFTELSLKRPL